MIKEELVNDVDFWYELDYQESKRKGKTLISNNPEVKNLLDMFNSVSVIKPVVGKTIEATYMGTFGEQHVFSCTGLKDDIHVENRPGENKYLKNTQIGDKIDVLILYVNEQDYYIYGSISEIYETKAREDLMSLDEEMVVNCLVRGTNPAGYDVDIYYESVTLPGFMPNTLAGINRLYDPESIVGQEMWVSVESFSESEGTYIVSRRKYLQTLIPDAIAELDTVTVYGGHVTGTTQFGVFVEFNECLTGMIHKANINPDWQDRISEIQAGFEIDFYVKEVAKNKIILTQVLRESLWDNIKIGQIIDGEIKDNKNFGSLVLLDDETMGLIHTSELARSGKKFTSGEKVKVRVLALDRQSRKIFLSPVV